MFWRLVDGDEYRPRFYLSGLPKAGLHLLTQAVMGVAQPMRDGFGDQWAGTHQFNSFTLAEMDRRYVLYRIGQLRGGQYLQAHAAYYEDIRLMLEWSGVAHVTIVRDLRDVCVSQAHHILSDNDDRFRHPAKALYRAMGGFDEVLAAVIEGIGPFVGVLERWALYAPWLEAEGTMVVRYEDMRRDLAGECRRILQHGLEAIYPATLLQCKVEGSLFEREIEKMVATASNPQFSPTFRKGRVGDWREAFTGEHRDLFKAHDVDGWLVRLGYENEEDW